MATQKFKLALNAASFPMSYAQATRSVVIPGTDVVPRFGGASFYGTQDSAEWNVIQLIYCENVIPIAKGLSSVGYTLQYNPYSGGVTDFDQFIVIKDSFNGNAAFSPARGKNYVLNDSATGWVSRNPFVLGAGLNLVTRAYVNGRTLIFYEHTKCCEWVPSGPTMTDRALTYPAGFTVANIRGNCAASNYHILHTDVDILWSSLVDVLNFNDIPNGSGHQIPIDLRGKITCCLPISGGFMIYTTENVVAATFTQDASRPFAFREVTGSGGVSGPEQVSGDANASTHFAYGTAGLQQLTLQKADSIFPEATDFLVSREVETWNPTTKTIVTSSLSQAVQPKLQYLGSRYLFVSYGTGGGTTRVFQFALVYDTALNRWGKIKIDHVDINIAPVETLSSQFYYYELEGDYSQQTVDYSALQQVFNNIAPAKQNYAFLQNDGRAWLWVPQGDLVGNTSVAIFGHVQVVRNRTVTVQRLELDGIQQGSSPSVNILGSESGYRRDSVTPMTAVKQTVDYAEFHSRFTCKNADLAIEGSFLLTNGILEVTVNGKR